jgi:protein TonB
MSLHVALLLSIAFHAVLIVAPTWLTVRLRPEISASIEARLLPRHDTAELADAVSTERSSNDADPPPPRLTAPPNRLQGRSLRRAQAAMSDHLFYPPQAVARGIEGEVVLLLILSDSGGLVSASIARSSGHILLDQAALDAAQHIGALPGNPRQTLFPVSFRLR